MPSIHPADPTRSALVLMDFQPRQVSHVPERDRFIRRVQAVRADAKRLGMQVAHVRVAFTPQDYGSIPPRNKAFWPVASGRGSADGTPDASIVEALAPEDGDVVVTKTRFGAFSTTNLDGLLRGRGIDTLFLAGLSTSGVVLSTIRDAGDRDYQLYVLADCCHDPDAELHEVLLDRVIARQATVISSWDFAGAFCRQESASD